MQIEDDYHDHRIHAPKFTRLFNELTKLKKFKVSETELSPESVVLQQAMYTMSKTYALVHALNHDAASRYDSTDAVHESKLLSVWEMLMPNEQLTDRFTTQWQKIGTSHLTQDSKEKTPAPISDPWDC